MNDFSTLLDSVRRLPLNDKRVLKQLLDSDIKQAERLSAMFNAKYFSLGDVVIFKSRGRVPCIRTVKVTGFNAEGTRLRGLEVCHDGSPKLFAKHWTASVNDCTKVSK